MPYKVDIDKKPDLSNLHRFGCIAYHHDENPKKKKFSNQGIKCQFLGYKGRNQYRLWDPFGHKVIRSSNVIWDKLEIFFPVKLSGVNEPEGTDVTLMQ